jgi:antitoxin CcdA
MKRTGMAEPKRSFQGALFNPRPKRHLSDIPARPKRALNVSVDSALLSVAKEMNINLSQVLEEALCKLTADERARRFYQENKAAIDSYNRFIERQGTLAEAFYGRDAIDRDDSAV